MNNLNTKIDRTALHSKIALTIAVLCFTIGVVTATPQQDYTLYGTAKLNEEVLTAQDDDVISLEVGGVELVSYTMGDNIPTTDNYVLKVPMDSDPSVTTAAHESDTAHIYINGIAINEGAQVIGAPATTVQLDISATSANDPPFITILHPNGGESTPIGTQVQVSAHATDDTAVTSVTFSYSNNSGSDWNSIGAGTRISGTAKDGIWNRTWNTNSLGAGSNYLIRAVADDGTSPDEDPSDSTFSLTCTPPSAPALNDPGTTDTDGSYMVRWSSVSGATSYTLEEDTSGSFGSPTVVYSGSGTSTQITDRADGTYYYRVNACNACGCGGWSDVEDIEASISHEDEGWDKTFGGTGDDVAYSVQQTSDGGFILAGYTNSYGAGKSDFWLVKTDSSGNKEWDQTYGGGDYDWGRFVQQTSDGGYILAGYTMSYGAGSYDYWIVKTNSIGNIEWDQTFGGIHGDSAFSVQQTSDGGYILLGSAYFSSAANRDFWLVKTDSSGNMEWNQTFGGVLDDWADSVQQTSDGGYILFGDTSSNSTGYTDFWLVKTDSSGNMEWDQTFGEDNHNYDMAFSVQQTSDDGYIMVGLTYFNSAGCSDFWLIKTDSSGNMEWDQTFGGVNSDCANSVQQTWDGGYIIAGRANSYGAVSADLWLVKTDSSGSKQWDKTFGGTDDDMAYSVQQTSDGSYIIAGYTDSYGAGGSDFWLIKLGTTAQMRGDLNSDSIITPADAAIALHLASTGGWDPAADVDDDNRITSLDALMILQAAAGAITL